MQEILQCSGNTAHTSPSRNGDRNCVHGFDNKIDGFEKYESMAL